MNKLFTNDKFFAAVTLISFIGSLLYYLTTSYNPSEYMIIVLRSICVLALYVSYWGHCKNVMKGMMGSLLMLNLFDAITWLSVASLQYDRILGVINLVLAVLLFTTHYVINAYRTPSPIAVGFNKVVAILTLICSLCWCVYNFQNLSDFESIVRELYYGFAFPCMVLAIVCVESRLDVYRTDRTDAGWSEEKGYPENYVHECDIEK